MLWPRPRLLGQESRPAETAEERKAIHDAIEELATHKNAGPCARRRRGSAPEVESRAERRERPTNTGVTHPVPPQGRNEYVDLAKACGGRATAKAAAKSGLCYRLTVQAPKSPRQPTFGAQTTDSRILARLELGAASDDADVTVRATGRAAKAPKKRPTRPIPALTSRQRHARWAKLVDLIRTATPAEMQAAMDATVLPIDGAPPNEARPLLFALAVGRVDLARLFLLRGASPNALAEDQASPLAVVAERLESPLALELIAELVDAGADINASGADGFTPLFRAIWDGRDDIALALLGRGADPNVRGLSDMSALHLAARAGRRALVSQLLDAGGDQRIVADAELVLGVESHDEDRVRRAHEGRGSVGPPWFPLKIALTAPAAANGDFTMARFLLELGADPNLPQEAPPIVAAAEYGRAAIVQFLLDHGAQPGARNANAKSALKACLARTCDVETMKFLLQAVNGMPRGKAAQALGTTLELLRRAEAYVRAAKAPVVIPEAPLQTFVNRKRARARM